MSAQHLAGFPVEEIVLAGLLTVAPMMAYLGWEITQRVRGLRRRLSRKPDPLV